MSSAHRPSPPSRRPSSSSHRPSSHFPRPSSHGSLFCVLSAHKKTPRLSARGLFFKCKQSDCHLPKLPPAFRISTLRLSFNEKVLTITERFAPIGILYDPIERR